MSEHLRENRAHQSQEAPWSKGSNIISIDIGTSSAKALLCSVSGYVLAQASVPYSCFYDTNGIAQQDAQEVLAGTIEVIHRVVSQSGISPSSVAAIVYDAIWQSFLPLDREDQPLCKALIWSDSRSAAQNELLRSQLDDQEVRCRTGCSLHSMYFLSRLLWFKSKAPQLFSKAARFVSIKEFILTQLYGARVVDASIASGTGVWNINKGTWDEDLLAFVGVSPERFSPCVEPTTVIGGLKNEYARAMGVGIDTPAVIGGADGAMAHLGAAGLGPTRMSISVGTSIALRLAQPNPGVIAGSQAWCYYLAGGHWLSGGVAHGGGNALHWFAQNILGALPGEEEKTFAVINELAAQSQPGAQGLFFLPLLAGERCPNYRPDARGVIGGLSLHTGRAQLARALYEGLAFCIRSICLMLAQDGLPELVITGGILKSAIFLQILANALGKPLRRPAIDESAAWGGVILGVTALGLYPSLEAACTQLTHSSKAVEPQPSQEDTYKEIMQFYEQSYTCLFPPT